MAPVRLTDAVIYDVYNGYFAVDDMERSALFASGIIATSPLMNDFAERGGKLINVPFWRDIDPNLEPNYSNDDPADHSVPNKIGSGEQQARKTWLNQSFAAMDLVQELAGSDPMARIRARFGVYWTRQYQRRLIASALGIMADNVANDDADMVEDRNDESFSDDAFIDTAFTSGDAVGGYRAVAVHSKIHQRMVKANSVIMRPDAEGRLTIPTYRGLDLLVMDEMPVDYTDAQNPVFTSILFGGGAFGFGGVAGSAFAFGEGTPATPVAVTRVESAGNGGGQEVIYERKTIVLHPFGFSWTDPTGGDALTELSPTLADLRKAAPWSRTLDRKAVPMAFLKTRY